MENLMYEFGIDDWVMVKYHGALVVGPFVVTGYHSEDLIQLYNFQTKE